MRRASLSQHRSFSGAVLRKELPRLHASAPLCSVHLPSILRPNEEFILIHQNPSVRYFASRAGGEQEQGTYNCLAGKSHPPLIRFSESRSKKKVAQIVRVLYNKEEVQFRIPSVDYTVSQLLQDSLSYWKPGGDQNLFYLDDADGCVWPASSFLLELNSDGPPHKHLLFRLQIRKPASNTTTSSDESEEDEEAEEEEEEGEEEEREPAAEAKAERFRFTETERG